jgi:Family of unknown function (DUF5990)
VPANTLTLRIEGHDLPGRTCGDHSDIHVGLQVGKDYQDLQQGHARKVSWETVITVAEGPGGRMKARGPAVHGPTGERFLYLAWLGKSSDGLVAMFRRAKLQLDAIPEELWRTALARGAPLVAKLALTDAKGAPVCASVRPPAIRWTVGGP